MEQIILNIKDKSKFKALLSFLKTLDFVSVEEKKSPYDPEFVNQVNEARQDYKKGNTTTLDIDNIDAFLGLDE